MGNIGVIEFNRSLQHLSPGGQQTARHLAMAQGLITKEPEVEETTLLRAMRRLERLEPDDFALLRRYDRGQIGDPELIDGYEGMGLFLAAKEVAIRAAQPERIEALDTVFAFLGSLTPEALGVRSF